MDIKISNIFLIIFLLLVTIQLVFIDYSKSN